MLEQNSKYMKCQVTFQNGLSDTVTKVFSSQPKEENCTFKSTDVSLIAQIICYRSNQNDLFSGVSKYQPESVITPVTASISKTCQLQPQAAH